MTLFKDKFKTNSHRLQNWDYSSEAVYFVIIVTKNRKCIFGTIEDEKMILNENGKIVENELLKSISIRRNWFFHNWIIMPNHIHLLIEIQDKQIQDKQIQDKENQDKNIHETNTVETHRSASTSSISTMNNVSENSLSKYGRETHCGSPLQNQSDSNILPETYIVETHRSASTSSIFEQKNNNSDNSLSTNVAKTHCGAPLQNQSDSNILPETYIVETHRSASKSSISTTNKSDPKFSRKSNSISSFVAIFKSITTKQINDTESIWQANYHDHIV